MKLVERLIDWYFSRMRREEKAALLDRVVTQFFEGMTAQEKQNLIEQTLAKLFDGIEMKEFLPRLLSMMWKRVNSEEDRAWILRKTAQLAGNAGGKITDSVSSTLKKIFDNTA